MKTENGFKLELHKTYAKFDSGKCFRTSVALELVNRGIMSLIPLPYFLSVHTVVWSPWEHRRCASRVIKHAQYREWATRRGRQMRCRDVHTAHARARRLDRFAEEAAEMKSSTSRFINSVDIRRTAQQSVSVKVMYSLIPQF